MPINRHPAWGEFEFVKAFNTIARHRHRYEVFRDFVVMSAAALHNAIRKDEKLEAEYLAIAARYKRDELSKFSELLAKLVLLLETEPRDVLGPLYMCGGSDFFGHRFGVKLLSKNGAFYVEEGQC